MNYLLEHINQKEMQTTQQYIELNTGAKEIQQLNPVRYEVGIVSLAYQDERFEELQTFYYGTFICACPHAFFATVSTAAMSQYDRNTVSHFSHAPLIKCKITRKRNVIVLF